MNNSDLESSLDDKFYSDVVDDSESSFILPDEQCLTSWNILDLRNDDAQFNWDETTEIELFLFNLCSFVSDALNKSKEMKLNVPLYLYDNEETPLNANYNKHMGIYLASVNNTVLPQGTYCIPVPSEYISTLNALPDSKMLETIVKGFNQTHNDTFFSVRQTKKIPVCHPFKRGKCNSVFLNSGFGLHLELKSL